jgi:hypothetical protein
MRIGSWDHYEISWPRFLLVGMAVSVAMTVGVWQLTSDLLGQNSLGLGLLVATGASYFLLSAPKRALESASLRQAREAPLLAAAAALDLKATGSTGKTILLLEASEGELADTLEVAKRRVLLGYSCRTSIRASSSNLASKSAALVLSSVVDNRKEILEEGEEAESLASFSSLSDETKVPLFIGVSFFTPIMITLLAVLGHYNSIRNIVELLILQFVLLDLAFSFSSTDRRRLRS